MKEQLLKKTFSSWLRQKDELLFKVILKDVFGNKYTIVVKSTEEVPDVTKVEKINGIVNKDEADRITEVLNQKIKEIEVDVRKKVNEYIEKVNRN